MRLPPRVKARTGETVATYQIDADDVPALDRAAPTQIEPSLVVNLALPYQDLTIMDACLAAGVDYLDTANYEPQGRGQVRIQLAVGLSRPLQGSGADGAARLGLRSRRHQRVHDVAQEA